MILDDWQAFRRQFGVDVTASDPFSVAFANNDPDGDTLTFGFGGNDLVGDGFTVPAAGSRVSGWAFVNDSHTPVEAAILDDGGVFTDDTTDAQDADADDVALLPGGAVAVGDAFYIGAARRFWKALIGVSQLGVGTWAGAWEYSSADDTWTTLAERDPARVVVVYDDSVGEFSVVTEQAESAQLADAPVLPGAGALEVEDALYLAVPHEIDRVEFDFSTSSSGEGWVITWEYSTGSASWSALSGVVDGTSGLKVSGVLTFDKPTDWEAVNIDAIDEVSGVVGPWLWLRGRVTTGDASVATYPVVSTIRVGQQPRDTTEGFTANGSVSFRIPDDWATATVNDQGPMFFIRYRVTTADAAPSTDPLGEAIYCYGTNDGAYRMDAVTTTVLTLAVSEDADRVLDYTQTGGAVSVGHRLLDDGDGVDHWDVSLVRLAASGFGDAGTTLSGATPPITGEALTLTANAGAADAVAGTDEYDWYVSHTTQDPAARYLDVAQVYEADGVTPRSGSIAITVSAVAIAEFGVTDTDAIAEATIQNIFRGVHVYVQRRSDGAIQLVDLQRAALTGVH